jgi:ankyrin repeat protein/beta-lactamase regulating signal transducer with metallopeptidase domain
MNAFAAFLAGPLMERLGWVLVHFVWQGTAVALVLAVMLRLAARASARTRYALAGAALLLCAIAPVVTWVALSPHERLPLPPSVAWPEATLRPVAPAPPAISLPNFIAPISSAPRSPLQARLMEGVEKGLPGVVGGWLFGVVVLSSRLTLGWMWTRRLGRSGVPARDPACLESFSRLLARMRIGRPVRLLESALVEVPMLIGWLGPTIVVPVSLFAGLTPSQLEAILAHELAHVRRHDYLVNLLQTVVETVLFYHPAVWWIGRRLREERENCCDDLALEVMEDRLVYVSALARLEEGRATSLALTASGGSLLDRIRRIAGAGERKASAWPLLLLLAALLVAAGVAKSRAMEAPVSAPTSQAAADARFDFLHNDLRLENVKATNMPLDQFVRMISREMAAQDPLKEGPGFVLHIPPGETPLRISLDFSKIPGYRANDSMIFGYLKRKYPIRYRLKKGIIYLEQISAGEIAFTKKAKATRIDLNFHEADPVDALAKVQAQSADKGFKFDLNLKAIQSLDAIKPLSRIDLMATQVNVDQALRSICYLADLHAQPLEPFTGYLLQPQSAEATKALTYLETGNETISCKMGSGEEKQTWDDLQKWSPWIGPGMTGPAYPEMGALGMSQKIPERGLEQNLSVEPKIIDKTHFQLEFSLEIKDSAGKSLGEIKGVGVVASGVRAILASSGRAALVVPGHGSEPAQGFFGVVQVTLMNEDGEPLLPPPSPGVQEIKASQVDAAAPASSTAATQPAPVPVPQRELAKALVAAAARDDVAETGRLLEQGADPNLNVEPDGRNALFAAVASNEADSVKLLLLHGADPNHKNESGKEPIDQTLDQGRVDVATILRGSGAKISPEAWAGATGDLPALQTLVQSGAIRPGHTGGAMKYAVSVGHLDAVKYLEGIDGKPIAGKFLAQAAKSGNVAMMQYILDRGANMKTDGGDAMDTAVIFFDQVPAVKFLLAHGADLNRFSRWNEDMLSEATSATMVKTLLEAGANPNALGDRDCPLTHAPDAESVRLMVQHGANLKPKLKDGLTLIQSAITPSLPDRPEVIDELIKEGAEFDPHGNGVQALLTAAQFNRVGTIGTLLDHGVSPNAYSAAPFEQMSALGSAAWEPSFEAVQLLLKRGANPDGDPREIESPLAQAVIFGQNDNAELLRNAGAHDVGDLSSAAALGDVARVDALLQHGANVDETDRAGNTPLFFAVRRAQVEAARLLLAHGANINLFDSEGLTPRNEFEMETASINPRQFQMDWGVAEDEGERRAAALKELLAQNPGDPNYRDARGRTVLHQMALAGNTMIDFPLTDKTHRADPNIRDGEGNTPLVLAALSPHATETVTRISEVDPADPSGKKIKDWNSQAYIADQLIRAGARLDLPMAGGESVGEVALAAAVGAKNAQLIAVLQAAGAKDVLISPPAPQGTTGKSLVGSIRIEVQIIQLDEGDYQAHRGAVDGAIQRGDPTQFLGLKSSRTLFNPSIYLKDGESGMIESVRVMPVPIKFENDLGGIYPTDFERRDVGVRIPVTASLAGGKIDVNGKLSLTTFEGWTQVDYKSFSPSMNTTEAYFFDQLASGQTKVIQVGQGYTEPDTISVHSPIQPPKPTRLFMLLTAEVNPSGEPASSR